MLENIYKFNLGTIQFVKSKSYENNSFKKFKYKHILKCK